MPVTEHRKRPRPNLPPVILMPRERELVLYFVRRYITWCLRSRRFERARNAVALWHAVRYASRWQMELPQQTNATLRRLPNAGLPLSRFGPHHQRWSNHSIRQPRWRKHVHPRSGRQRRQQVGACQYHDSQPI